MRLRLVIMFIRLVVIVAVVEGIYLRVCDICRCDEMMVDCGGRNVAGLRRVDYMKMGTYHSVNLGGATRVNLRYLSCRYFGRTTRIINLIGSSAHCGDTGFDGCKVSGVRLSRQ